MLLTVCAMLAGVLMVVFILAQKASFGGTSGESIEGIDNPLRRTTGYLAAAFFVFVVAASLLK